jgi:hypothetical protein
MVSVSNRFRHRKSRSIFDTLRFDTSMLTLEKLSQMEGGAKNEGFASTRRAVIKSILSKDSLT